MKKSYTALILFIAGTSLSTLFAQSSNSDSGQVQIVRVATLESVEANQEFQRNVKIMQAMREEAGKLQNAYQEATSAEEKSKLKQELQALQQQLNENNQQMIDNYGFSLNRNYIMVIEKSYIYMQVSEEEAKRINEKAKELEQAETAAE